MVVALIAASVTAAACAAPVPDSERYAPTRVPDRIVLTWTADPKTTQTVTWRTSTDVGEAFAQVAPADHGPGFIKNARRITAESKPFVSDLSTSHMHTCTLDGLEPGTVYAYRVGDGETWSEWFQFRTEPAENEPFSFVYFGDSQNDVRSMWSRVTREAFRDAPRAAFFLHAGDLVNRADSDGEWGEWFEAGSFINAMIPVVATPGNHEYVRARADDGSQRRVLTEHFEVTFAFPENGPSGLTESVFTIDYGDMRLISLNSNERLEEQVAWLDRALEENDRKWTAVTFHHPVFAMAKDRDNPLLRELWRPILDKHAVDIVLCGHDHTYGRTGLVGPFDGVVAGVNTAEGAKTRSDSGTVYVVSVSGPKMYAANPNVGVDLVKRAEDTQLYQVITIDGDTLRYEARTAVGELYDAFTLRKSSEGPNVIEEGIVSLAPRRRGSD